jgi:cytochrome c oxidase subunit 2
VDVEAFQFAWSFTHPEIGIVESNQLTLLKDKPVTFNITSRDVNHAFWVPEFRIKQDATNGFIRKINITPNMTHKEAGYEEGFPLRCAELCGAGHSGMLANVRVLEEAEYAAWQEEALSPSAPVGVQLYQANGCIGCHELDIAGAVGAVGPTHNGMASTVESRLNDPSYTGSATTVEEYLQESVRNPNVYVVPDYAPNIMPALSPEQLSDEDLNELVKMLLEQ